MAELVASGRIVDLIIGLMVVEGLVLAIHHRRTGRGIGAVELAVSLLAGAFLLLSLRAALTGAAWPTIAMWLTGALVAHLADVARRWRR